MTDLYIEDGSVSDWIEISRLEALMRLENILTVDALSLEIDPEEIETPLGIMTSFGLTLVSDYGEKQVLLVMKDPSSDKPPRWFLHNSLNTDGLD